MPQDILDIIGRKKTSDELFIKCKLSCVRVKNMKYSSKILI